MFTGNNIINLCQFVQLIHNLLKLGKQDKKIPPVISASQGAKRSIIEASLDKAALLNLKDACTHIDITNRAAKNTDGKRKESRNIHHLFEYFLIFLIVRKPDEDILLAFI